MEMVVNEAFHATSWNAVVKCQKTGNSLNLDFSDFVSNVSLVVFKCTKIKPRVTLALPHAIY